MKSQLRIIRIFINPLARLMWTERVPVPLPRPYTGGRRARQYRHTPKNAMRLHDAATRAGFVWSQDRQGILLQQPNIEVQPE